MTVSVMMSFKIGSAILHVSPDQDESTIALICCAGGPRCEELCLSNGS